MIKLYHGGLEIIETPEIRESNRTLDFGSGFYLTSSPKQAEDWVRRRLDGDTVFGYVSEYDFALSDALSQLNIVRFDSPTDEWLDFVMSNRRIAGYNHSFDIVIGPVANDRVYTAFALYEGGTISKSILIQELKTYRLVDQYLFHSPRSLSYLNYKSAKKVMR